MYHGIGGPLGEGDFRKGRRLEFMLKRSARLNQLGWCPMFELKGDDLSGDWVKEVYSMIQPFGGMLTWHWSPKSTKTLGNQADPVSKQLCAMAAQANELRENVNLQAVTIHMAPAMAIEPAADAGWERYDSPIGAAEMLAHIKSQVEPLRELNGLCGGILQPETVDIANFRDNGFKLPNFLALQTGSWRDLIWLCEQAGTSATFDSEHRLCAGNLLMRQREMTELPVQTITGETADEQELAFLAGYRLRQGQAPYSTGSYSLGWFVEKLQPRLFHFGAAIQAFDGDKIMTHLPYDRTDKKQMDLLDFQLRWIMSHPKCLGGVTEVVGQLYADDPANPGHNRFSRWSDREPDDEKAKEETIDIIIERIEALTTI